MSFKIGDKVRVVDTATAGSLLTQGVVTEVTRIHPDGRLISVKEVPGITSGNGWYPCRFELVEAYVGTSKTSLKPQLQAILDALRSGPKTARQVATAIGVSFARNVPGRIRDLRTAKYGSHKITTSKVDGRFIYALEA